METETIKEVNGKLIVSSQVACACLKVSKQYLGKLCKEYPSLKVGENGYNIQEIIRFMDLKIFCKGFELEKSTFKKLWADGFTYKFEKLDNPDFNKTDNNNKDFINPDFDD